MMVFKLLLLITLAIVPMVPVVFALPGVSTVVVVGLVGFWVLDPSWGPWLYVGSCLSLMQWRAWEIYVKRLKMAKYVFSPSMHIQNRSAVWLGIGAVIGSIRSFAGGDLIGGVLGGLVAVLLLGLQGILFPNPTVISRACGHPMVAVEELSRLLEKTDYPTLLKFNRQARRKLISGLMLASELARMLEENERQRNSQTRPEERGT